MVQIIYPKIQKWDFYDFEMKFWYQFDKSRRKIQNPYVQKGRKRGFKNDLLGKEWPFFP